LLDSLALFVRYRRIHNRLSATPQHYHECDRTTYKQEKRPNPEKGGRRFHRWPVQDEVAVPLHQEVDDLLVAHVLRDHLTNLTPQILRKGRIRIRQCLVLAHEAAEFDSQVFEPCLSDWILGQQLGFPGPGQPGYEQHEKREPSHFA
jgi:hypothetical protein